METYDLVIVGSGSGLMVLEAALEQGLSCALVEKDPLGGTCLNRGCIPSKVLVYPADVIREAEHAARVGVHFDPPEVDWPTIAKRMWTYIGANKQIEAGLKKSDHLALYRGTGVFTGPDTMQVADERSGRIEPFSGRMFVLAPGARTLVPPIQGLESVGFITSESFFGSRFPEKPWKSLTIVGGGAIGLEFAHIFSAQGTRVTIVEMASRLAPLEEPEISAMLEEQMRVHGIRVLTGYKAVAAKL
ncbi:MAG: FAD-dependent oxidoreductase, partial [Eubacteriales bacterium]|nr:FAD-dependent oxidoreductase [Eubacteriales bacterium]